MNALAATATALQHGVELSEVVRLLETFEPPKMRSRVHNVGGVRVVEDCYNASPSAMIAAIESFAAAWRQRGQGALTISTPSGSPNAGAATVALSDVRDLLNENGVGATDLAYTPYRASGGDASAPLILSFKHYVARPTACGNWTQDAGFDPSNGLMPNHGCATQNNLAAMVANPADLLGPRPMDPADPGRRNTVLEKYRAGEPTATARGAQDSGAVSEVAQ